MSISIDAVMNPEAWEGLRPKRSYARFGSLFLIIDWRGGKLLFCFYSYFKCSICRAINEALWDVSDSFHAEASPMGVRTGFCDNIVMIRFDECCPVVLLNELLKIQMKGKSMKKPETMHQTIFKSLSFYYKEMADILSSRQDVLTQLSTKIYLSGDEPGTVPCSSQPKPLAKYNHLRHLMTSLRERVLETRNSGRCSNTTTKYLMLIFDYKKSLVNHLITYGKCEWGYLSDMTYPGEKDPNNLVAKPDPNRLLPAMNKDSDGFFSARHRPVVIDIDENMDLPDIQNPRQLCNDPDITPNLAGVVQPEESDELSSLLTPAIVAQGEYDTEWFDLPMPDCTPLPTTLHSDAIDTGDADSVSLLSEWYPMELPENMKTYPETTCSGESYEFNLPLNKIQPFDPHPIACTSHCPTPNNSPALPTSRVLAPPPAAHQTSRAPARGLPAPGPSRVRGLLAGEFPPASQAPLDLRPLAKQMGTLPAGYSNPSKTGTLKNPDLTKFAVKHTAHVSACEGEENFANGGELPSPDIPEEQPLRSETSSGLGGAAKHVMEFSSRQLRNIQKILKRNRVKVCVAMALCFIYNNDFIK